MGASFSELRRAAMRLRRGEDALQRGPVETAASRRPWILAKCAVTLDGRIATRTRDARWVTGPAARVRGRRVRQRLDAILVGSGTILADDPWLTARRPGREPVRVVFDRRGRTPASARLFTAVGGGPVWLVHGPAASADWRNAVTEQGARCVEVGPKATVLEGLERLAALGIRHLVVEGGGRLLGSMFEADCVDFVQWFVAPKVLGGGISAVHGFGPDRMEGARRFHVERAQTVGGDVLIEATRDRLGAT